MTKGKVAVASALAAGCRVCGGRSRVPTRLAVLFAAVLVSAMICSPAYADTPAIMWDSDDGSEHLSIVRGVNNEFTAALYALGYERDDVTDATWEIKLTNEDTGGRFYEFAKTFTTGYEDADDLPDWVPTYIVGSIVANSWIDGNAFIRGLWFVECSSSLYQGALEDLRTILGGGSLGGGDVDYYVAECSVQYVTRYRNSWNPTVTSTSWVKSDGTSADEPLTVAPNTITVMVKGQFIQDLIADASSSYHMTFDEDNIYCAVTRSSGGATYVDVILFKEGTYTDSKFVTRQQTFGSLTNSYLTYNGFTISSSVSSSKVLINAIYFNCKTDTIVYDSDFESIGLRANNSDYTTGKYGFGKFVGGDGGGGTNNWPSDDDDNPQDKPIKPVVPEPDPIPDPDPDPIDDPSIPDPDPIDDPVGGGNTTVVYSPPTDTTVIENWLSVIYSAIVDGFNAVTTDMNTHCLHIQSKLNNLYEAMMKTLAKYITSQTSSINNNVGNQVWWLARQIDGQFDELKDYMHELAVWLADQLDFSVTIDGYGYDDTSVVAWLKKIYAKLGGGGANERPVDPVSDDDEWWEWILRALQNWTLGLGASANDLVSNIGELLSRLISKFPFGIPWMTLGVITTMAADPVTPEFVVTIPSVLTLPELVYTVDLEPYDSAAATVRTMEYIVFGGYLLMKTPKVINEMMGVLE